MDLKKFVNEQGLSDFPVGLGGCRISDFNFDSCEYNVVVFDEKSESEQIAIEEEKMKTLKSDDDEVSI